MNLTRTKTVGEYLDDIKTLFSPIRDLAKLNRIFKRSAGRRPTRHMTRNYAAAKDSRLLKDWPTSDMTADAELYSALKGLRVRSRHLAKNNDYAKRFFSLLKTNVIGHAGVGLQVRSKDKNGKLDKADNEYLETEWKRWGKKRVCDVTGKLSWLDCQKLFVETVARDGECIVRKIKNWPGNRFKFALQFIEPDMLDERLNKTLPNGNTIRLGIEFNQWRRPVFYHLKKFPATASIYSESYEYNFRYDRIPASEIIHEFVPDRIGRSRGIPWMHTAAKRLHMLGGYEEAEVIAARTASAKMGFFKSDTGTEYVGDEEDPDDPTKAPIMNAEPGTFEELPAGLDFVKWDPDHPTSAYEAFVLAILRGVASGLDVAYVSLANDLRGVSYSSIRQGAISERDSWKTIQGWTVEHFHTEVWESWLKESLISGALNLPLYNYDKFNNVIWRPRGWSWVDPLKESKANENAVKNGFKSFQDVVGEQGKDFSEVLEAIKSEIDLAKQHGINLPLFEAMLLQGEKDDEQKTTSNQNN
jgi:lambda family phage portal protein